MLIKPDIKLNFSDVLIEPKRSALESRANVNLVRNFKPKYGNPFSGIPIMASNMATGTFNMLDVFSHHKMFVSIAKFLSNEWMKPKYKYHSFDDGSYLDYGFYTIGMSEHELDGFRAFYKSLGTDVSKVKLCVDIANGYSEKFVDYLKKIRDEFKDIVIVAGNVATPEMVQQYVLSGVDYVKTGISGGLFCETRKKTSVGYPQLSAVIECADAAHGLGAGIISDGGIRNAGDVAKALGANADFVMIGSMFSGTDQCHGDIITRYFSNGEYKKINIDNHNERFEPVIQEKKFKLFYGMSSDYAQSTHLGEIKGYRTSEGLVEEVPYIGSVEPIIKDILGGLRSTGTYIGADDIKNFGKCTTFIRTNRIHDKF